MPPTQKLGRYGAWGGMVYTLRSGALAPLRSVYTLNGAEGRGTSGSDGSYVSVWILGTVKSGLIL